jgi:hypothetical protein
MQMGLKPPAYGHFHNPFTKVNGNEYLPNKSLFIAVCFLPVRQAGS